MPHSFTSRKRIRKNFGKHKDILDLPNLIEVQLISFKKFLEGEGDKSPSGIERALKSVFPIEDPAREATVEYVSYEFDTPKYDIAECITRGITYQAPMRLNVRLILWEIDEEADTREVKGIKEQKIYFCDMPLMTPTGTFVINGSERVIVSQMHRSPGVFYDHDSGQTHSSGKFLYSARIIPYRGSWLDYEFDPKDFAYFRIDRKRKIYISSLLQAIGLTKAEILEGFYGTTELKKNKNGWYLPLNAQRFRAVTLAFDLIDADSGEIILETGTKVTGKRIRDLEKSETKNYIIPEEVLGNLAVIEDIVDGNGEVIASVGSNIEPNVVEYFNENKIKTVKVVANVVERGEYLLKTTQADKNNSREEALMEIYKVLRPGEPPTPEVAEELFNQLFFDKDRYDLSNVGRMKISNALDLEIGEEVTILTNDDIRRSVEEFFRVKVGKREVDDIDHLGNRRVRSVGELAENQFRLGLLRMERAIVERISAVELDTVMPNDLINSKTLSSVVKDFFGSSQLSQFMDQTNPLSEVTHKRRLSALGPGGLTRERAGFEVRDVHTTHYGRICPIETPEGPNIGLINSLSTYAKINDYGFIETPYREVKDGKVGTDTKYMSAIEEGEYAIAQADAQLGDKGEFTQELVPSRVENDFTLVKPEDIQYADVSPKQLVSVAASLIPFLENDDANRALMGSNMQRQAVPLLKADAPLVGTGMERTVALDSGAVIRAKRTGVVDSVDSNRIVIRVDDGEEQGVDIYNLRKYSRSNQNTCINQLPIVKNGDQVKAGEVICDGPSTDIAELALGKNVVVAFMPWNGYNFEDSILLSERIVRDDVYTSVHIEEFEVLARDTKLGPEEVTRDIPNVGEESLVHLDECGIVHQGAHVTAGDILVGKVTPKSESPMTPEEKLLRAIFGEKAAEVRDTSLRMKPGQTGTVIEVRVFSRRGIEKDARTLSIEMNEIERLKRNRKDELDILSSHVYDNLQKELDGKELSKAALSFKKGHKISRKDLSGLTKPQLWDLTVSDKKAQNKITELRDEYKQIVEKLDSEMNTKIDKLQSGDDLPTGVLKMVKVFVAIKRKIQPGDKMAGRHGNKGVISRINPLEDMPYLEDGRAVDIVLNPLGVPSRMNVGQILETHLGWASHEMGRQINDLIEQYRKTHEVTDIRNKLETVYTSKEDEKEVKDMNDDEVLELANNLKSGVPYATPVFDGISADKVGELLEEAGCHKSGQSTLYDGRTGEKFDRQVTVGVMYIIKLHHLVDEKIHARSVGPYSLVTQQPLGGKSHLGGQRFGEMECWALQAYGASYTLQELLTVKSDDVQGRTSVYKSIVKGDNNFTASIPESFNVLVKELRSLCLNLELREDEDKTEAA